MTFNAKCMEMVHVAWGWCMLHGDGAKCMGMEKR